MGNLSFFLGGKAASDDPKWAPTLQAVRAAILLDELAKGDW
jgi:hypothetical protein